MDIDTKTKERKQPSALLSLFPIVGLVLMISMTVMLFGSDALMGGSQVSLLFATALCTCVSMVSCGTSWRIIENGIKDTIGGASVSIVILLLIGMLSGSWMISGVVPTLIYYGVQIMSPDVFLVCTCLICSVVSLMTGSSWTTIATIGVALLGIGAALGIPNPWTAGAIISGAYFGDKLSPLSDTTILASSQSKVDLFVHIRYMFFTTVPSLCVALVVFLIAGFNYSSSDAIQVSQYTMALENTFNISLWTLLIPFITGILIARKVPSLVTLFVSSVVAGVFAIFFQPHILTSISGDGTTGALTLVRGMMITFFTSTSVETGVETVNTLVSTGGMAGMLNTIWLILCAMCFGGSMMASGMLNSLTSAIMRFVRNGVGLVASTVGTGVLLNIITADQYISIILTSSMYKEIFTNMGYEKRLLSRTSEDSATVTSVLIPWNTCGMTQATVLGVPTIEYLPYCVFNYVSPFMSVIIMALGWKIVKETKKNI